MLHQYIIDSCLQHHATLLDRKIKNCHTLNVKTTAMFCYNDLIAEMYCVLNNDVSIK